MKYVSIRFAAVLIGAFAVVSCALGQAANVMYQTKIAGRAEFPGANPVTGAPYSATMTNETTQTLEDGTHIVQTISGNVARDSQGRTRRDAPLPTIGNLSATSAPHIVFIQDPVTQVSYTLDLTDKTAQKMETMFLQEVPPPPGAPAGNGPVIMMSVENGGTAAALATAGPLPPLPPPPPVGGAIVMQKTIVGDDAGDVTSEDLGSQVMQGVTVIGMRTTHVIPKGQIGNDAPISVVNEVWTSPELKTVVYSKRTDPRMGVQTFQLTNITRTEPDPAMFTVPADFKVTDGPQPIIYRLKQ